ncbi:putative clock controled protein [Lipomyces arxii]|uniref:putative clock controled protein n=1 Tax=Lipomyces arxii TaxID=56418 RepID=UPI0034CD32A9
MNRIESDRSNNSELFNRMANYTLVSSAVKVYESGKSYSRGFRYGAEMVESVARPVVRRFEPLEGFALRQLDRLERKSGDLEKQSSMQSDQTSSRWHSVITNASGLTVALSDESLKSLRYCVQWLKYANSHIENAISTLRDLLDQGTDGLPTAQDLVESQQQRQRLLAKVSATKADIVQTIRKVVSVVSTYAGAALPEPARSHVRDYILILPSRWAQASSAMPVSRRASTSSSVGDESADREHANRVIVLAGEALQMLSGVMHVVGDTLDRADGWVDRLGRRQQDGTDNVVVNAPKETTALVVEDVKMEVEVEKLPLSTPEDERRSFETAREPMEEDVVMMD